ncbi:MAG TPA: adenylate/guanylate cyclase domain-containing protein [Actinomycetota bacterium]|nr:adenylate/guanylate cyclase domain-containing protein [Actinomycetota bacterium]
MKRCASCGEENADRARFCQSCATPLGDADAPASDVRKVVSIVFADVTGSTALGERLDPEALRRVMGRYFDEMAAVIERHGGTVEKFIGDAVMAVFGIPRLHEDDAVRAVRAAIGMREALETLNRDLEREHGEGLAARIGVNTGEVVAGDPAAGQRLVTGDPVNVAARLEQAAPPGEILLGDPTYRLVKDAVEVEPVDALALKGKEERVPAFRLLAVSAGAAGHERHLDSPMVGRAKELSLLEHALERSVSARTSDLFTLMGPAGVGKSRLVHEFLSGAAAGATVLRGRCLSYGDGITLFPLAEVIHRAAGILDTDPPAVARGKLAAVLTGAPEADRAAGLVAGLFGWGEPGATEDAFWAVRKLLEHLAREHPVVLVFDDIHWGEPTFLDLIEHLADWTREAAVLLLCIARPELLEVRPGWGGGKMNATSILLEPLPTDEASQLVDNLLGRADIPQTARHRILEAAEGNPLFVEEMLAMLIDDGLLRLKDGAWRAVEDLADVTVPPTIHLLLAARLDRLDAEERAVIERGSVEGKVFHSGAVTSLSPQTARPNVRSRLLALARKELIRPDRPEFAGEDAFRFRHLLIRDAAYQAMPKEHRAELHERFAGWLEEAARDRMAEYEEILAHHLEQAYRYRAELGAVDERARAVAARAVEHLASSAARADDRGDLSSARSLLERCIELAEGDARARGMVALAELLQELGEYTDAYRTAVQAIEAAEAVGDRHSALRAEIVRIRNGLSIDPTRTMAAAREDAERVLAEADRLGDQIVGDLAILAIGLQSFFLGQTAEAMRTLDQLSDRAPSMGRRERAEVAAQLVVCAHFGWVPVADAFAVLDRAAELRGDSLAGRAHDLKVRGAVTGMRGRFDEARAMFDEADALYDELGAPMIGVATNQVVAETLRLEGRLEDAERVLRQMYEAYSAMGETGFNSTVCGVLAAVLCDEGRFEEADTFARRSRELAAEDDFASQSEWRTAEARVLLDRGRFDEALRLADQAIEIADVTDYLDRRADCHEVRGLVLGAAGRGDDARAAYGEALALYTRKGNLVAAARVRKRIEGVSGSVAPPR